MWIKICGVTRLEDAVLASRYGADAVGFIFAESPRGVDADTARKIISRMPAGPAAVGVFVDAPLERVIEFKEYCCLDLVQLHGDEDTAYCRALGGSAIKAVRMCEAMDVVTACRYDCAALLFEAGRPDDDGDTGAGRVPWETLRLARGRRVIAAGGLTPGNVADVVKAARPFGVDVASGVESAPGIKDAELMREFIEKARKADCEVRSC